MPPFSRSFLTCTSKFSVSIVLFYYTVQLHLFYCTSSNPLKLSSLLFPNISFQTIPSRIILGSLSKLDTLKPDVLPTWTSEPRSPDTFTFTFAVQVSPDLLLIFVTNTSSQNMKCVFRLPPISIFIVITSLERLSTKAKNHFLVMRPLFKPCYYYLQVESASASNHE